MLQQYKHILVPVDGSYEAELAFEKAVVLPNETILTCIWVHVVDTGISKHF